MNKRVIICLAILGTIVCSMAFALLSMPVTAAQLSLQSGIVAYWSLDEKDGIRFDSTDNNNDLTDNNTVDSDTGILNDAASFSDDDDEYFSQSGITLCMGGDLSFTISAWVWPASSNDAVLVERSDEEQVEYSLLMHSGTTFTFDTGADDVVTVTGSSGSWNLLVAWYDGTNSYLQINNGAVVSHSSSSNDSSTGPFIMGRASTVITESEDYLIDEVGFWDRTLTDVERAALYNCGSALGYPFDGDDECPTPTPTSTNTGTPTPTITPTATSTPAPGCGGYDGLFDLYDSWASGTWVSPTYRTINGQIVAVNTWYLTTGYYTAVVALSAPITENVDIAFGTQNAEFTAYLYYCSMQIAAGNLANGCEIHIRHDGYYRFIVSLFDEGDVTLDSACLNWVGPAPQVTYTPRPTYTPQPTLTPRPTLTPYPTWYPFISPVGTPTPPFSPLPTPAPVFFK